MSQQLPSPSIDLRSLDLAPGSRGEVHFAVLRLARRLVHTERRVIALVPASQRVGIPGVAVEFALAMVELGAGPVCLLDANPLLPAFSRLVPESNQGELDLFVDLSVQEGFVVTTSRLRGQCNTGIGVALESELTRLRPRFRRILVDLTGYRELGEQLLAYELADGVLVVAHTGRTHESSVSSCCREIPEPVSLGVLLIG